MRGMRQLGLVVVCWLVTAAAPARAADLSLQLQPGYTASTLETKDATGEEHRYESSTWLQKYRLTLDLPIFP